MSTFTKWVLLFIGWPFFAFAQLQITHPMSRLVVQRGSDGNGRLYLSGRLSSAVDRVEASLTPVSAGQGNATGWQVVQTNPTNNVFLGYVTGSGGWYILTVRTLIGNTVIAEGTVQPVGIGEVFVTAGQSNSRGLGIGDNDLGAITDRVSAIDSINHSYPPGAQALVSSGDPMPVPVFKPLTAGRKIFPMAESSWGWGELGDYIVNRYNVPVAFYVAGWDGSTAENWYNTANGIPTCNRYFCAENWPNLQPYTNLKNVLHYYNSIAGIRAVLWHQGEAEYSFPDGTTSIPQYYDRLVGVIQKSRQDFGGRNVPWMVARASFDGTEFRPAVVTEQQRVIDTPGLNVYQGPYNDTIVNRNAGNTDVHFKNSSRPATHPRYYLNPASIPAEMGLSRFARNWNNSLSNSFFQNTQPVTPTQFAVTGTVADYIRPGDSLYVPFSTLGSFAGDNQWQVQLLDSLGRYWSTLGSGSASPIKLKIPDTLRLGSLFQLRVVATSPFLPAVPSNLFRTSPTASQADVSLAMGISQRLPDLNGPVTISLFVQNNGPGQARNVVIRDRLPDNLAFISSTGLTVNNNVLTSNAMDISPGTTQVISFVAQPTAGGTYSNAAEIAQMLSTDPDSQANSGTGDGQDDMAMLDFRTKQGGSGLFVSPNPNQVPLPTVVSNQPIPDPAKIDISLNISVDNRVPRLNDVITYSLTISNAGGANAAMLFVIAYLPSGQVFESSSDLALSSNGVAGSISNLAAATSRTLQFKARITAAGTGVCTAQILAASQPDPDSVPGNGTSNGEDDTAQVDVRVK
ncbi:sialate O-acetylesterase [Spirosoma endbachense]|uniref:DUF11 domain-containing protein n=1 Tax=Spirosoma endbachense TaxID=2666025 RepID=A0A6P1W4V9_9BACT|nr:sialate O-acetylesterase [Spirosoma endbachense]QHV99039.1 DUF11 domain-containing protein [Spirosoma endbachense]